MALVIIRISFEEKKDCIPGSLASETTETVAGGLRDHFLKVPGSTGPVLGLSNRVRFAGPHQLSIRGEQNNFKSEFFQIPLHFIQLGPLVNYLAFIFIIKIVIPIEINITVKNPLKINCNALL